MSELTRYVLQINYTTILDGYFVDA